MDELFSCAEQPVGNDNEKNLKKWYKKQYSKIIISTHASLDYD